MTTLRAYAPVDIFDAGNEIGTAIQANSNLLVVETFNEYTYYFGDFTYPGDRWEGTVRALQVYDHSDETLILDVRGFALDTRHFTVGASPVRTLELLFADRDRIIGSPDDDRLAGFDGADRIRGAGGDDVLLGYDGWDTVFGGSGGDVLRGGRGRDALYGGPGDDQLWGGDSRDFFHFTGNGGRDLIRDFVDRQDKIVIDGSPESHLDLDIRVSPFGHTVIRFDDTEIVVRDTGEDVISKGDFLFG